MRSVFPKAFTDEELTEEEGREFMFLLEDDCRLRPEFMTLGREAWDRTPDDWDLLHVGGMIRLNTLQRMTPGLHIVRIATYSAHFMVIRQRTVRMLHAVLQSMRPALDICLIDCLWQYMALDDGVVTIPGTAYFRNRPLSRKSVYIRAYAWLSQALLHPPEWCSFESHHGFLTYTPNHRSTTNLPCE